MSLGTYQRPPMGTAEPKPHRGAKQQDDHERKLTHKAHEDREMRKARKRDGGKCRWPRCECRNQLRVDVCHEEHRQMGGNPKGDRTRVDLLICLCLVLHGKWDRGEVAIVPQDRAIGFNGPADFYNNVNGRLELYASEKVIGVSSTRDGR